MKYIKLSIVGLCVILMANGCNAGKGHPGVGFIPKIKDARMINVKDSASTYTAGDQVTFSVQAEDQDLNMKTLWVTEYHPTGSETPYDGPNSIILPKQSSESMTYSQLGPITLSGPTGDYKMDIQIEDASGNKTNVFSINFTLD
jgi:hypothetical protein